jgi:hypothetical protein
MPNLKTFKCSFPHVVQFHLSIIQLISINQIVQDFLHANHVKTLICTWPHDGLQTRIVSGGTASLNSETTTNTGNDPLSFIFFQIYC